MPDASHDSALISGAWVYAQQFGRVPPPERSTLDHELEDLPTEARNAVTLALWSHSYEAFCDAVRRELVHAVPAEKAR